MDNFITKETLENVGITLPDAEFDTLLVHLNESLEERVGNEIIEAIDDNDLDEFLQIQETGTDEQTFEWMQQHVPDYEKIVQAEVDILLGEVAENVDGVNQK